MRAIVTCVEYADILAITLPRMVRAFDVVVLTDQYDTETLPVAVANGAEYVSTPLFHKHDAKFNKGAAMEMALDRFAKDWTCILDADIVLPEAMDLSGIEVGFLYSPYRRLLVDPGPIPDESEWTTFPQGYEQTNNEYAGYFQLFHANDERFAVRPRYEHPGCITAQGCDSYFHYRWRPKHLRRLPFEVLHLGPLRVNWSGRLSKRWK